MYNSSSLIQTNINLMLYAEKMLAKVDFWPQSRCDLDF